MEYDGSLIALLLPDLAAHGTGAQTPASPTVLPGVAGETPVVATTDFLKLLDRERLAATRVPDPLSAERQLLPLPGNILPAVPVDVPLRALRSAPLPTLPIPSHPQAPPATLAPAADPVRQSLRSRTPTSQAPLESLPETPPKPVLPQVDRQLQPTPSVEPRAPSAPVVEPVPATNARMANAPPPQLPDAAPPQRAAEIALPPDTELARKPDVRVEREPIQVSSRSEPAPLSPTASQPTAPLSTPIATPALPVANDVAPTMTQTSQLSSLAQLPDQVVESVRWLADQKGGEVRVRLNPPELGHLDIRVSVNDDQTYVTITANNAQARDALEQHLGRLRALFDAAGLDLADAQVAPEQRESASHEAMSGWSPEFRDLAIEDGNSSVHQRAPSLLADPHRIDLFA